MNLTVGKFNFKFHLQTENGLRISELNLKLGKFSSSSILELFSSLLCSKENDLAFTHRAFPQFPLNWPFIYNHSLAVIGV